MFVLISAKVIACQRNVIILIPLIYITVNIGCAGLALESFSTAALSDFLLHSHMSDVNPAYPHYPLKTQK